MKKDQELALALYETGNHDAMYLAGISVNPKLVSKEILQHWVNNAYWYYLSDHTISGVTAMSEFALELAREWIESDMETVASCGWSTYASYLSMKPDEELNLVEISQLMKRVESTIHEEKNRVRYAMNGFVISVGSSIKSLYDESMQVAEKIGKVQVNMGQTACKVPFAPEYLEKTEAKGRVGVKRKTSIC